MLDNISQIIIPVTGISAIFLIARKNKYGFLIGLSGQPFWLYSSYVNEQWGIFISSIFFTLNFAYGYYIWFLKEE